MSKRNLIRCTYCNEITKPRYPDCDFCGDCKDEAENVGGTFAMNYSEVDSYLTPDKSVHQEVSESLATIG